MDMTPMVDVAFLLLTFFMLTTVFSTPQALEINLPESDAEVPVAESNVFTVRVTQDGQPTWAIGVEEPTRTTWEGLRDRLAQASRANPNLVTVVKVDREGSYTGIVDALDELQLAGITRFGISPMTEQDEAALAALDGGGAAAPADSPAQ